MGAENVFYSDIAVPDMLYARVIRSKQAPGVLEVVSAPELPAGYTIYTAEDIPGTNAVSIGKTVMPVFSDKKISYVGEPVGILVGPDIFEVDRLVDATEVSVLSISKEIENSPVLAERTLCCGTEDPEAVYEQAEQKIDGEYTIAFTPTLCAEYAGCLASYKQGELTLHTPSSWTDHLQKTVSAVLGIKERKIWVQKTISTEQNSNSILQNSIIVAQAALASFLRGKPVRLEYTQNEHERYVQNILPVTISHKTALNANGMFDAMLIQITAAGGTYNPFASEIIDRLVIAATGIYRPKTLKIEAQIFKTHTPPAGVYFPWVDYNAFFAVESHIRKIAQTLRLSPIEIRSKNSSETALFRNSFPFLLHLADCRTTLQTIAAASDYSRKYVAYELNAQYRLSNPQRVISEPVRGIGLAIAFDGSAFLGSNLGFADQQIEVTMEKSGSVIIRAHQTSPAMRGVWLRIAAEELDILPENIKIQNDLDYGKDRCVPDQAFDDVGVMVQLLRKCCEAVQKQRFRTPLPIKVSRSISTTQRKMWNQTEFRGTPFFSTSSAAAVVELEVDPYTYCDTIRNIWLALDCGEILVANEAERTIKKTVQNVLSGLGKNDDFNPKNIHISFIKNTDEAHQIGCLVYRILPAAYGNALGQAISDSIPELPLQANTLFNAAICPKKMSDDSRQDEE
jgi:CO/xanthine dehydrogenase Mo-binding subunit